MSGRVVPGDAELDRAGRDQVGDLDDDEAARGVRCKRRHRLPGTGPSVEWLPCPGVVGESHRCSVCGMPPRDYRPEWAR